MNKSWTRFGAPGYLPGADAPRRRSHGSAAQGGRNDGGWQGSSGGCNSHDWQGGCWYSGGWTWSGRSGGQDIWAWGQQRARQQGHPPTSQQGGPPTSQQGGPPTTAQGAPPTRQQGAPPTSQQVAARTSQRGTTNSNMPPVFQAVRLPPQLRHAAGRFRADRLSAPPQWRSALARACD